MRHCLVITTYNNAIETVDLLYSLEAASISFDKILIVDDCSTKSIKSLELTEFMQHHSNVEIYELPQNFGGPAKSRNFGLVYAIERSFDLVTFIDPDDRLDRSFTSELKRVSNKYKSSQIFTFSVNKSETFAGNHIRDRKLYLKDFRYFNPLTLSGLTIKLESFSLTKFSEQKTHIAVEDYKFYIDAIFNGNEIIQSTLPMIRYGASGDHLSKNKLQMFKKFSVVNLKVFGVTGIITRLPIFILRGIIKHYIRS